MWEILITLRVITAHLLLPVVAKNAIKRRESLPQSRKLTIIGGQFIVALLLSVLAAPFLQTYYDNTPYKPDYLSLMAIGLGILNSYGVYCFWRAMDISVSKTAIGTQLDDLIAILIEYFFFGVAIIYRPPLLIGIALCFTAIFILAGFRATKKDIQNRRLIEFVIGYSIFWGMAAASYRFFNLKGLPMSEFLICWYAGSCLGTAMLMFFFNYVRKEKISLRTDKQDKKDAAVLGACIWVPMVLHYMVAKFVPVVIYQPIFLVTEAVFPALIGLYYFHEGKEMTRKEWIAIVIGLTGTIIVGLSFAKL